MPGVRGRSGGHNAKPAAIHLMTGTFRSDRHGNEEEAEAAIESSTFPTPPAFLPLSDRAQQIWASLGEHCGPWMAQRDWIVVWGVVRMIERLILNHEAQLETDDAGHPLAFKHVVIEKQDPMVPGGVSEQTIVEAKGNPLVDQEARLFSKLSGYLSLMGLSPIARTHMPRMSPAAATQDPLTSLMKRARTHP
jgi:phage terminase small subunit